ncbi:MAG: hypothetical protein AABX29_09515 [Nanoarchaeota archaeon]
MTNPLIVGIPVIPKGIVLPKARYLSKAQVQAYQERIRADYKDNALRSLNVLSFNEQTQEPQGSNPFVLYELIRQGITPASIATLESLVETNPEALREHYEDYLALVLRTPEDSYERNNSIIAGLLNQAKKTKFPVLISGPLKPVKANNDYGLNLKLTDQTTVINAPELAYENNGRRFIKLDERGVPIFLSDEEISQLSKEERNKLRTFYARQEGLSWLYLDRYLDLYSYRDNLVDSISDGRVVVESAAGAKKI